MIKFIVDAQLPYSLAVMLKRKGFDVIHTDDLPNKERTTEPENIVIVLCEHLTCPMDGMQV